MISAVQPTVGIKDLSFDELKSETNKDRFELFAEQLRSEMNSDRNSSDNVSHDSKKDSSEKEQDAFIKIKSDFSELGDKLKEMLGDTEVIVEFSLDKDTNKMILKLIDNQTNEVIRQIPSDLALRIARLVSSLQGGGQIANAKI